MSFVKGIHTGLFVSEPAEFGQAAAIQDYVLPVRNTAPQGSLTVRVRLNTGHPPLLLPAGALLRAASTYMLSTSEILLVDNEQRHVPVRAVNGTAGTPRALNLGARLYWDGLARVTGTSNSELRISESTQERLSVVYDAEDGPLPWVAAEVLSKHWTLDRAGNYKPTDPAYLAVEKAAVEGREVFVRRILPDEVGEPARLQEGRAFISNFRSAAPADGIVTASWEFRGQGPLSSRALTEVHYGLVPEVMLDFRQPSNAVYQMFV